MLKPELTIDEITLICPGFTKHRVKIWYFECKCGKIKYREEKYLKRIKIYQSCGCKRHKQYYGNNSKMWKGCGTVSGHYFSALKHSAKIRNIPFNIKIEDIWNKYEEQDFKCAISGKHIVFNKSRKTDHIKQTASVDRINSKIGYQIDNIQIVHKSFNRLKHVYSMQTVTYLCRKVVEHAKKSI